MHGTGKANEYTAMRYYTNTELPRAKLRIAILIHREDRILIVRVHC
jgi:hypothetical protein